jgi:hypothetical protein
MGEFLRDMGIKPHELDKGVEGAVRELAEVGGADPDLLLRYSPHQGRNERFSTLAGEVMGVTAVNRTFFRFCPKCVEEDLAEFPGPMAGRPWLRLQWVVSHFRSCGKHGIYFEKAAPLRRRFQHFDFAETIETLLPGLAELSAKVERAPASPFQDWLLARIDGVRAPDLMLDDMPLGAAAEWCEALGVSA